MATVEVELWNYKKKNGTQPIVLRISSGDKNSRKNTGQPEADRVRCGITQEVSSKLARTSFSRIANEVSGRNVYGIQQATGHTQIATTEIYLRSDNRAVDELLQVVYAVG